MEKRRFQFQGYLCVKALPLMYCDFIGCDVIKKDQSIQ